MPYAKVLVRALWCVPGTVSFLLVKVLHNIKKDRLDVDEKLDVPEMATRYTTETKVNLMKLPSA